MRGSRSVHRSPAQRIRHSYQTVEAPAVVAAELEVQDGAWAFLASQTVEQLARTLGKNQLDRLARRAPNPEHAKHFNQAAILKAQ